MKKKLGVRSEKLGVKTALFVLSALLAVAAVGLVSCKGSSRTVLEKKSATVYTCPMHHQIRKEQPGECPICGMTLVPLEQIAGVSESTPAPNAGKKIKYWASPMHPEKHSDKPTKDEMGMDYVPVYEEEAVPSSSGAPPEIQGLAPVHLTPYKEQLIGVRYVTVGKTPLIHTLHTTGRFSGGGDFTALAADFAAQQPTRPSGQYVVAEIYALDQPFVRTGQKAWVSPLSGSGPRVEGRVAQIYPYEGTQSRILRVRINLSQSIPNEIFANVAIEAVTPPRMSVPSSAVEDTGTRQYVFVETSPGVLKPQLVSVGLHGDEMWEITSGLKSGDRVVDGAVFMIDADSKIKAAFQ